MALIKGVNCDCGAQAYIYYMIDGGKYYCGECFQGKHIKNLSVALRQINNQKNTIDVQAQTLNEQAERIGSLEAENKILKEKLASKKKLLVCKLNPVPICECGKLAGYNVLGIYYCPECVTKVIKL